MDAKTPQNPQKFEPLENYYPYGTPYHYPYNSLQWGYTRGTQHHQWFQWFDGVSTSCEPPEEKGEYISEGFTMCTIPRASTLL